MTPRTVLSISAFCVMQARFIVQVEFPIPSGNKFSLRKGRLFKKELQTRGR